MKRSFWTNLVFLCICFIGLGLALAYGFAKSLFSPMELGLSFVFLIGCLFTVLMKRHTVGPDNIPQKLPDENIPAKNASAIRMLRVAVVGLPVLLVLGLWLTQGEPLAPRVTGAAINLFITCWLISVLRRAKRGTK